MRDPDERWHLKCATANSDDAPLTDDAPGTWHRGSGATEDGALGAELFRVQFA